MEGYGILDSWMSGEQRIGSKRSWSTVPRGMFSKVGGIGSIHISGLPPISEISEY